MKSYPMSIQWWYYDECNVTYEVLSSIQWWYYDECNVTMKSYRLYNDDTMMNIM
jgi:hypothetical protein